MNPEYLIISGTNRLDSASIKVASEYFNRLTKAGKSCELYSLEGFKWFQRTPDFLELQERLFIPAQKFIFVMPEYNGSVPGVLKLMIDLLDYKRTWHLKKVLLVGVSSGRAGNLRGMEHMTGILHYLKAVVHPNKLPISRVDLLVTNSVLKLDQETSRAVDLQIEEFIAF